MFLKVPVVQFAALALLSRGGLVNAQSETGYFGSVFFSVTACSLENVGLEFGCSDNKGTIRVNEVKVDHVHTTFGVTPRCNQVDTSHYHCTLPPLIPATAVDSWLFFLDFDCIGSSNQELSGFVQSNILSDAQCSGISTRAKHGAKLRVYDWERGMFLDAFSCSSGTLDQDLGCVSEALCYSFLGVCSDQYLQRVRAWQNPVNIPQGAIRTSNTRSGLFGGSSSSNDSAFSLQSIAVILLVLLVIGIAVGGLVSCLLYCRKTRPSNAKTEVPIPDAGPAVAINDPA